jgi:carboxymethylenebutenolidase
MNGLNWPKALEDIKTIKEHLEKDSKSVSIVGFCMGGALAFASVASIKGFKAAGVFYGIPDLNIFRLDKITANVIAHFGRLDPLKGFSDAGSAESLARDAAKFHYPIKVR